MIQKGDKCVTMNMARRFVPPSTISLPPTFIEYFIICLPLLFVGTHFETINKYCWITFFLQMARRW